MTEQNIRELMVKLLAYFVIAQMVEQRTANMKVPGSNPGGGMTKQIDRFTTWLDSVPNIQSKLIYHAVGTHGA